jgi:hypothetical protein
MITWLLTANRYPAQFCIKNCLYILSLKLNLYVLGKVCSGRELLHDQQF